MADQGENNLRKKPRQGSVKDLIMRTERRTKQPQEPSPTEEKAATKRLSKKHARRKSKGKKSKEKTKEPPIPPVKPVLLESFPEGSLQRQIPHSIEIHNQRLQAKFNYMQQQKQLQREYEAKIRDLHHGFVDQEGHLLYTFPTKKTAEAEKKLKTIEKLKKDIKNEKDNELKTKIQREVSLLEADVKALRIDSEIEFDNLNGMWLSISASEWDMLLAHPNHRQPYGYNQRNYGVFEAIRRKDDHEVANPIGTEVKKNGRKVELGNATFWTLGQISNEENTLNALKNKKQNRLYNMTRRAIRIAGVDDSKANREKAMAIFKEKGWKALREVVNSFGKTLDNKTLNKLAMEESQMDRVVVVRVTRVDRTSEQLKVVMILDRNGRPIVGGLPAADTKKMSIYEGADQFITPPTETELMLPPLDMDNVPQSLLEALAGIEALPQETEDIGNPIEVDPAANEATDVVDTTEQVEEGTEENTPATPDVENNEANQTEQVEAEQPAVTENEQVVEAPANPAEETEAVPPVAPENEQVAENVEANPAAQVEGAQAEPIAAPTNIQPAAEAPTPPAPVEEEEDGHIEGYCTTERVTAPAREFSLSLSEVLGCEGVSVIAEDMKTFFKDRYNTYIPHITYQRIAGFQVFNNDLTNNTGNNDNNNNNNNNFGRFGRRRRRENYDDAGDFQIVDLGIKLGLDPLIPLEEYDQVWRNGMLFSVKHRQDGPIRFVGFNETGFGFMEDRPIDMHVQKIVDNEGKVTGVNIMHMTLYDTNDQICFDTLYLKDEEDMKANKSWKVFGKDAIGNRLAYRIVAQNGEIQAVLYPFQGRVKRAKLHIKDVTNFTPGDWVNIKVTGQTSRRLARIKLMPTGMVVGKIAHEKKSGCSPTVFLEMIRERQRAFAEMPGLVDLEIFCEDDQLLREPRIESWPVECCHIASEEDLRFMKSLELEKEEEKAEVEKTILSLVLDAKNFVGDRSKRSNNETFLQEAANLNNLLAARKAEIGEHELVSEIDEAINLLQKTIKAVKRAAAFRKSKERKSIKNVTKDV